MAADLSFGVSPVCAAVHMPESAIHIPQITARTDRIITHHDLVSCFSSPIEKSRLILASISKRLPSDAVTTASEKRVVH